MLKKQAVKNYFSFENQQDKQTKQTKTTNKINFMLIYVLTYCLIYSSKRNTEQQNANARPKTL